VHLRTLFEDDPKRGERFTVEVAEGVKKWLSTRWKPWFISIEARYSRVSPQVC
jgi:hypothetical protein